MHHFLGDEDLTWLTSLDQPTLSANEKRILVFVKETGAIDNGTYRDLTGAETLKASTSLRHLCDLGLLVKKGQSTATYYISTEQFILSLGMPGKPSMAKTKSSMLRTKPSMPKTKPSKADGTGTGNRSIPKILRQRIDKLGSRSGESTIRSAITAVCEWRPQTAEQLATVLGRNSD
jgi:ATP-dependent DNA helicase RecG